ncbi:MAG: hypothetical protein D6679_04645 [Candidatus Hydrogenedentota bacterium]|nr:MAG: hypothetical protein D6679_04645 [Candidatus Hydrogenedentota bacterium]
MEYKICWEINDIRWTKVDRAWPNRFKKRIFFALREKDGKINFGGGLHRETVSFGKFKYQRAVAVGA